MKKRVVSLLLCLIMALSLIPTVAFATEASSQDDGISLTSIRPDDQSYYTYEFYNGSTLISTQTVKQGDVLYQPETPTTPEGKVFTGWYDEKGNLFTGFGKVDEITKSDTIKLTAKIEDGYYVFFMNNDTVIDTKTGETGTVIKFDDVSFPVGAGQAITGWYTDKGCTASAGTSVTIGAKNIYLYAKVENGHWITFDSDGGSYVEPKFFATSADTEAPAAPTKPGYDFADWYNGKTQYTFGSPLTADITLKAKWTEQNGVRYTVIHWKENANDDGYSFAESVQLTGTPGQLTEDAVDKIYKGFTLREKPEQKTIAGNGSTIVNVYYKRNVYKVTFAQNSNKGNDLLCGKEAHSHTWNDRKLSWGGWKYKGGCYPANSYSQSPICGKEAHNHNNNYCYGTIYNDLTITAKYGAYIGDKWPTKDGSSTWGVTRWDRWTEKVTYQVNIDTMPLGGATFYGPKTGQGSETAYYYVEVLPGETGTEGNGAYKEHHHDTSPGTGYKVSQNDKYRITGFTYDHGTSNGNSYDNAKFYYTRNSHDIVFFSGGQKVNTVSKKYEESIADVNYKLTTPPAGKEGYTFVGWYDNDLCEGEKYVFAGKTMPDQNITLYAKWEKPVHTVTVYDSNRTTVLATLKKAHKSTIDMNKEMPNYTLPKGYKFLGWVLLEDGTPFNFNTQITRDYKLYAKIGSMATYTVTYDANDGSGTMADNTKYAEGAIASVMANGFTPPNDDKVFLGWSTTASGSVAYYANSQLKIEKQNVILYAIWGDKDSTVTLTYNANYGEKPATNTIYSIKNNAKVTLKQFTELFPARDGYRFTGWNTQADGKGDSFDANERVRVDKVDPPNVLYAQWKRQTGTLIINKVVEGVTLDENKTFQFQLYTMEGTDEYVPYGSPIAVTVEAGGTSGSTTVSVPTDMYFVQEIADSAAIENYSVTTAYERVDGPIPVLGNVGIDGTAAVVTESGNTTVKVTNTYEAQTADLTIVKKLNTALPQNVTFKFNVMEGTSDPITAEITIKAGELEGSTTVSGLKIGKSYTVQEDSTSAQVIGYTLTAPDDQDVTINATGARVEFVNNYTKDTTSVTVTKEWELNGISEAQRPAKITVQLMQGNTAYGEPVELYETNDWTYTWTGLDMYNATGSKIVYSVKEVNAPDGFTDKVTEKVTADHPSFIITNTATVAGEAEVTPASLTVIKTDAKDGTKLEGAKFVLIAEDKSEVTTVTTGKDGKAVFTGLTKGTYTLKEVTAPEGYQATDKIWTITVSDDAQTAGYVLKDGKFVKTVTCKVDDVKDVVANGSITITNVKATGTVTINKTLNVALPKDMTFKFNVMKGTGEPVSATITIEAGKTSGTAIVENLTVGTTYTVQEVAESAQLDGYTVAIPKAQTVKISGVATKDTVSFTNTYTKTVTPAPEKYTFTIDITKNIELLKRTSRNPGKASFTFEAYMVDKQKNVTVLGDVTIETRGTKSASGKLTFTLTDEQLTDGATVYVREVEGNARGWTYDGAIYKLEIGHDGKIVTGDTGLTFTNVYYRKASSNTPTGDKPIQSVKTGDMGIAMYAMTSLLSLGGAALVIKKRREEK